jgi:hypothetical protein
MKKLYRWILIAVLFQLVVFSYIEFIYLPNRGNVRATAYEMEDEKATDKSLKVSSDMEDITVSYNGFYVACRQDNKLVITDIRSRKKVKTLDGGNVDFTYFRWLPDRDMLIYSTKEPEGKKGQVMISTYDVGANLERSYPKITKLATGSEVIDIELSPLTNVVYSVIKTSDKKLRVYKFNIMDDLSYIMNTSVSTVFKETMYDDSLVYQTEEGKITIRSGKNGAKSYIPVKGNLKLFSLDADDNIYVGSFDESGKVAAIQYGKSSQKADEWKKVKLDSPITASDVYITPDGSIYRKAENENLVYDLKDGNSIKYIGEFLEILDNYIVSRDNGRLRLTGITKD